MRFTRVSGLAGLVTAAALFGFGFGPQAGADPLQEQMGAVQGQACGYGVGFLGTTPFAPMVGVACTPPQGGGAPVEMPVEALAEEAMPVDVMPEDVMPAE
ncbi:hypothetical protein [Saccharothrix sp. NRRL B-16348]|uniref:hypothetical protein n=1 Tax=Saccharothrix sp. NRRL B-16348 TaxID=1415542 RepID=UPI000A99433E|nr:hypothetical protein [Saccharothrix sp. NRRL B-16348]